MGIRKQRKKRSEEEMNTVKKMQQESTKLKN